MKWFLRISQWIGTLFYAGLTAGALGMALVIFFVFYSAGNLPKLPHPLARIIETPKTEIYAATGEKLITLGQKEPVPLSRISPHFINAILAVEDHRFMAHSGFNKLRTLKALQVTLMHPGRIQGASTITQQLAKNLFFSFEKTWLRKFKELLVALQIEYTFSKEEILHAYVNQIAFGAGAQGVERASRIFWGKSAADLTLAEATLLAGLPQSPSRYNPFRHYDRALKRREVVIGRMVATGYLNRETADKVLGEIPRLATGHGNGNDISCFTDAVIARLISRYGKDVVFHGGLKVTTTLDTPLQQTAVKVTGQDAPASATEPLSQTMSHRTAMLVVLDIRSGAVKTLVCGKTDLDGGMFSKRTIGAQVDPFICYVAMGQLNRHGASSISLSKTGETPLKKAFAHDMNTLFSTLIPQVNPADVLDIVRQCGIQAPANAALTGTPRQLGTTPLEMAAAYATLAATGIYHAPFFIRRVTDSQGQVIYDHLVQGVQALDAATAFQVLDMMQPGNLLPLQPLSQEKGRPAAGRGHGDDKTGATWFTGVTPRLAASVWIKEQNRKKKSSQALPRQPLGDLPAKRVWASFMSHALQGTPIVPFPIPAGIRFETIDSQTGYPTDSNMPNALCIPLRTGQIPAGGIP